jgi:CRP-like cAMP-binding protein
MIQHINMLRRSELFSELTEDELCVLMPFCTDAAIAEEGMIFNEGREASHVYVLTEGKIALQKHIRAPHARHSRRTTITLCYPGETVGWSALMDPFKYTLSAVAWESSKLVRIDAVNLRKALAFYPEVGYKVTTALSEVMARRLRHTIDSLINQREISFLGLNECNHTDVA